MSDPSETEFDLREFCARVLREYEEVIATIIQRPYPRPLAEGGPQAEAVAREALAPAERA